MLEYLGSKVVLTHHQAIGEPDPLLVLVDPVLAEIHATWRRHGGVTTRVLLVDAVTRMDAVDQRRLNLTVDEDGTVWDVEMG